MWCRQIGFTIPKQKREKRNFNEKTGIERKLAALIRSIRVKEKKEKPFWLVVLILTWKRHLKPGERSLLSVILCRKFRLKGSETRPGDILKEIIGNFSKVFSLFYFAKSFDCCCVIRRLFMSVTQSTSTKKMGKESFWQIRKWWSTTVRGARLHSVPVVSAGD